MTISLISPVYSTFSFTCYCILSHRHCFFLGFFAKVFQLKLCFLVPSPRIKLSTDGRGIFYCSFKSDSCFKTFRDFPLFLGWNLCPFNKALVTHNLALMTGQLHISPLPFHIDVTIFPNHLQVSKLSLMFEVLPFSPILLFFFPCLTSKKTLYLFQESTFAVISLFWLQP